jgi:hypothetical protein
MTHRLLVTCDPSRDGWHCQVTVGDDAAATAHDVTVDRGTLEDLAPGSMPEALVEASFEFLLERETREAIMRHFELPIIGRFFPDYADALRARFQGAASQQRPEAS